MSSDDLRSATHHAHAHGFFVIFSARIGLGSHSELAGGGRGAHGRVAAVVDELAAETTGVVEHLGGDARCYERRSRGIGAVVGGDSGDLVTDIGYGLHCANSRPDDLGGGGEPARGGPRGFVSRHRRQSPYRRIRLVEIVEFRVIVGAVVSDGVRPLGLAEAL